jgi:predicted DNA-binding protein with PD1-like motif
VKFSEAKAGRCFILRLEHDEVIHEEIERFAVEHGVQAASVALIGAVGPKSRFVVGPADENERPVNTMTRGVAGVSEAVGNGVLVPDDDGRPQVHVHMACGREGATVTGCIRKGVYVWQTMEVVIRELRETPARRLLDSSLGFGLLEPEGA